jgi:hypothetical protein
MDSGTIGGSVSSGTRSSKVHSGGVAGARKRRNRNSHTHRFANYLSFGFQTTVCLGLFVACYALVLLTLWPLLNASTPESMPNESARDYIHHMHVPPSLKEAHIPGLPNLSQDKLGEMASGLRKRLQQFRQGRGVTDGNLLDQAMVEFESKKKDEEEQSDKRKALLEGGGVGDNEKPDANINIPVAGNHHNGFIVLGMHRSGTSMLAGLLHTSAGYTVGGPLIGSAFDNEKGFFERIDIVLQNDQFMNDQQIWWASDVYHYDWEKALRDKESGAISFENGKKGLKFLNDPNNAPWMQKDPRMCITLKTWLKLMNTEPAILFTYRHPLEVALSLKKREQNFTLEHGLRLWIVYNMRAVQNSKGLCMVKSSNDAIMANPLHEIQRIQNELTNTCGVPAPPDNISQADVDKFIDPALQHNRNQRAEEEAKKPVLETYNDGKCKVYNYESTEVENSPERKEELLMYRKAMKVYCDFQSGVAYNDDYQWPHL